MGSTKGEERIGRSTEEPCSCCYSVDCQKESDSRKGDHSSGLEEG